MSDTKLAEQADFVRKRITELRLQHNLSEYELSLALGHSQGYIQSIVSGRTLPSMAAFFEICNFFNVEPWEFFSPTIENPTLIHDLITNFQKFPDHDQQFWLLTLKRILAYYEGNKSLSEMIDTDLFTKT